MKEKELRQLFKNRSDCYADTEGGEVIQAVTEDRFIEVLREVKILPIIKLVCPDCGTELQLEIKEMTNSDLLNALKANDR